MIWKPMSSSLQPPIELTIHTGLLDMKFGLTMRACYTDYKEALTDLYCSYYIGNNGLSLFSES